MKEVEKKAHLPLDLFEKVKHWLTVEYGLPEHIVSEDDYYAMPARESGAAPNRFRIRKNYDGHTMALQSIVANTKHKQITHDGMENNEEIEFSLQSDSDLNNFVDMMKGFGAHYWYHKRKDKWIFVYAKDVEYHMELCTLIIAGKEECFLEIEGVFDPTGRPKAEVELLVGLIGRRIDEIFVKLGLQNSVETRAYRILMGIEYPKW